MLLMAEGLKGQDIAERLTLSPKTVSTYRARLLRKMNIARQCGTHALCVEASPHRCLSACRIVTDIDNRRLPTARWEEMDW